MPKVEHAHRAICPCGGVVVVVMVLFGCRCGGGVIIDGWDMTVQKQKAPNWRRST